MRARDKSTKSHDEARDEAPGLPPALHLMLRRAHQALLSCQRRQLSQLDLTPLQVEVLQALKGQRGLRQVELARRTGTDRSSMAELAARLERRGLIRRAPDPKDKRALLLFLTPKGRRLLARAAPLLTAAEDETVAALTERQRERLFDLLRRLAPPEE